jgi:GH24 family phage-related lysozyme (muramidase)
MTEKPDLIPATAKVLPPWLVVASDKVAGLTLNDWVLITALFYTVLQIIAHIRREYIKRQQDAIPATCPEIDRRREKTPVKCDRRQKGKAHPALIGAMATGALVVALAGHVATDEGTGPTTIAPTGETIHHAYPDPAHGWKVPTICNGRTRGVFPGMSVSAEQCRLWLEEDLTAHVIARLAVLITVPVTQSQAVALGRLMDNLGETEFRRTQLLRRVNAGDCLGAAREWNAAPQLDKSGRPRIWHGRTIRDRQTGAVLLAHGDTIKKFTTAAGQPQPGLIKRRAIERAQFEADCAEGQGA